VVEQPASATGAAGKAYLYGLDLVRFAASVSVVLLHLSFWVPSPDATVDYILHGRTALPALVPLFRDGWIGVDVFFVISGLVIAYSAEGSSAVDFLRRRALRLLPGAWIAATLSLAVAGALSVYPLGDLLTRYGHALVFWPPGPWIDGTFWTLPIELSFYALVFATLALKQFRWVEIPAAILGLASTAYWAVIPWVLPNEWWRGLTRLGSDLLVQNGCEFALGVFLWLIFTRGITWIRLALALLFTAGAALEIVHTSQNHAQVLHLVDHGPNGAIALFLLGLAAIVASLRFKERIETALGAQAAAWVQRLGLATYPLYLLHTTSGAAIIRVLTGWGVNPYAAFVVAIASCLLLGLGIALGPEPWLRRRLSGLLGGGGRRAVPATETS
jgi:peptidoglycan/LPS O-acetylase OafA/YrhL